VRVAAAAAWLAVLWAAPASACTVCYGNVDGNAPLVAGARWGIYLLLGVTAAVLGGLTRFFFYLHARARRAESEGIAAEWADLQRSAR
jgi:hypothetical protein